MGRVIVKANKQPIIKVSSPVIKFDPPQVENPPLAPNIDSFTFQGTKYVDVITYCSDPLDLPIELLNIGVPTNGLASIIDNTSVGLQPADPSQPTTVPYTIVNSEGRTATGTLSVSWEDIEVSITSPVADQEFTDAEDVTVAFEVMPEVQNYISAIGLWVDGVEVEKRTPYSTDDFTIAAGSLSVDSHNIMLRAYDANDEVVYNTQLVYVDVVASATRLLDIYPNQFGESWSLIQRNSNFTGDLIEVRRSDNQVQLFGFDSGIIPIGAISSFVGSGDGCISWYKGQANGLVVEQPNAANQPWLFKAGVLQTEAGLPTLRFEGNQWLENSNILSADGRPVVSSSVTNVSNGTVYFKGVNGGINERYGIIDQLWFARTDTVYSLTDSDLDLTAKGLCILNQVINNNNHKALINNNQEASISTNNNIGSLVEKFVIGSVIGTNLNLNGTISEVHIWLEDVESNLSNINGILNNDYGIY